MCRKRSLATRFCGCRVFKERRKTVAAFLYFFSLIIVKSLQLRGCRQIAEPRKYCLVCVIVLFSVCFLYFFFFVSHRLEFRSSTTLCPNIFSVQIAIQKSFLSWDTLKTHLILSLRLLKANHIKEFSFLGQSDELYLLSTLSQT